MEKEIRQFNVEFHANSEARTIEGVAIPFNFLSPNREGFREVILPEAVEGVIENSDIFFLYNHSRSEGFLARCNKGKGSLKIDTREDGVHFTFKAKKDNLSNYVLERLADGELSEMSFAFTVARDSWEKQSDGSYIRTIEKFERLYDLSVVDSSYYGVEGAVKCRSFEEFKEEEARKEAEAKAEEERLAQEKLEQEQREAEEAQKAAIKEAHEALKEQYKDYMLKSE